MEKDTENNYFDDMNGSYVFNNRNNMQFSFKNIDAIIYVYDIS